MGAASYPKLRFKTSGDARNAVKCFEIGRNEIFIFNVNKYTPKNNTLIFQLEGIAGLHKLVVCSSHQAGG